MRTVLLVIVLILLVSPLAQGATYVISPDGSGDFTTLGECVAHCGSGEIIELTDGMFTGAGNVNMVISAKTITIRSQSGSAANCRINCEGEPGITKRAFIIENGAVATIENIALENGYCTQDWGGAILVRGQALAYLRGLAFRGNYASWGGALAIVDGAAYVEGQDCRFQENVAEDGGGAIYNNAAESIWSNTRFIDNTTNADGGACHADNGPAEFDFYSCIFSRNLAGLEGGAVYHVGVADCDMVGCTLSGNSCAGGSAFYVGSNTILDLRNTLIIFTTEGVGLDCQSANFDLENNNIFGNAGGDWISPFNAQLGMDCNVNVDPQLCSPHPDDDQDWTLQSDSPCTSFNSPCGQIGAFGAGCGISDNDKVSWGAIKRAFDK